MQRREHRPSYAELLRYREWREKRAELLAERGERCEYCGTEEGQFDVHHGYYEPGLLPWEHPNDSLHVLCRQCHDAMESSLADLRRIVGLLNPGEIAAVAGFARATLAKDLKAETHDWLAHGRQRKVWPYDRWRT